MFAGSIRTVYDLLLRYNLHIVGEKFVKVNHCLMAQPGVPRTELSRVLSHPQALAQCQDYLRELGAVKEAVEDTAGMLLPAMQCSLDVCRNCARLSRLQRRDPRNWS